jgi:hypothetical protein
MSVDERGARLSTPALDSGRSIRTDPLKEVIPPVPVRSEQDRELRRDDERIVEEIRRLFERYRETARQATEPAQKQTPAEQRELSLR